MMDNAKTSRKIESSAAAARRVVLIYTVFAALWIFVSDTALEALVRNPADWARVGMFKGLLFVAATALLLYGLLIRLLKTTGEAQQALAAHYAKLIEQARDIVLLTDPAGRIVEANRAAEAAYGYPHAELLGMMVNNLRAPDSLADVERQWAVAASAEGVLFETRHRHRDGRVFPVEVSSRAIEIEGKLYRQSFIRDITERKQAETAAIENNNRLTAVMENLAEGLIIADQHGLTNYWNPMALAIYGFSSMDECRRPLAEFAEVVELRPLNDDRVLSVEEWPMSRVMRGERLHEWACRLRRPDQGWEKFLAYSGWLIHSASGETFVYLSTTDITEREQAGAALQEKERLLLESQRIAHIGSWSWAFTGPIQWTDETYRLYGVSPETFIPTFEALVNLVHPEDRPIVREWTRACGAGEMPAEFEFRCVWPDGTVRFLSGCGELVNDAENRPTHIFGTVQDITERKESQLEVGRAAQAAQDSRELLDFALNAANLGDWSMDLITNRAHRSLRHDQCFGYTEAVPVWGYDTFLAHVQPMDRDRVDACYQKAMAGLGKYDAEFRTTWPDGSVHWLWANGRFYFDDKGSACRVAGIVSDITERKLTETALRASETEFRTLAEAVPQIVWITRPDGWNVYFNQQWVDYTGLTLEESNGHGWNKPFHPDDQQRAWDAWQNATQNEATYSVECRLRRADGAFRWWLVRGVPLRDASGKILKWFGTCTDIEEIKQTTEALQETQVMLARTEEIGKLGGWEFDIDTMQQTWTRAIYAIHEVDFTGHPTVEQGISFYTPESQPIIEQAVQRAIEHGEPFDLELEIITAKGNLRAVHTIGRHDSVRGKIVGFFQDITERKQAQIASEVALSRLQATFDALPDLLFEADSHGRIFSYHSHRSDLLAAPPEVFIGKQFADFLPPDAASACQNAIDEAAKNGFSNGMTYRLARPQGEYWFELSVVPLHADAKFDQHFIMICRDITERKRAEESLLQAASVFGHTREGITITDRDGTILNVNEAFTRITGFSREDAIGQNPRILSSGRQSAEFYKEMWDALIAQGHWSGEIWNRRKDGEVYAELLTISAIRDGLGVTQQYVALFSDITAIKAHQSQLEHMAHFDALTSLPNRVLLVDRLHQAMAQAQRRQQHLVVAYLDLDGFKTVNDQHGHDAGDQVLIILAKRLKEALREGDSLARIGGDEFVAVLADLEDTSASLPLLNRLQAAAKLPVELGELSLSLSASLGVTFYPQVQDIDGDQLLRQADQAMYQAKVAGKNRYCIFDAAVDSNVRKQHESLARIRLALERQEFVLYYQPKVNMRTGKVIGAEALIRWQHPEDGLLAPAAFLPAIEDHPLAVEVGEWVVDTAIHQIEVWRASGLGLPVSVNIGARQLLQDDFVERLQVILAKHPQVHPGCIALEVLETSALNDLDQVSQVIEDCAKIGMRFALDDFGTGYSSLTYLKRLHVTQLKIDQSFVRDMLNDPDDLAILQGIIGLAAAFNREVIAEGVETVAHGTALLQLGCELAQGYGIARPMPPDQLPAWAATWQPDAAWGGVMNPGETPRSTGK